MLSILVALSLLGHTLADSFVQWIEPNQSVLVKLDTPGYPMWTSLQSFDHSLEPVLSRDRVYNKTDMSAAILLNVTVTHDKKTLLLNHQPILPLDPDQAPRIRTYQVPAHWAPSTFEEWVKNFATGIEDIQHEASNLPMRLLELYYQYIRFVPVDCDTGVVLEDSNEVILSFNVWAIGAVTDGLVTEVEYLNVEQQTVLQVTLRGGSQGEWEEESPDREYSITNIEFKSDREAYWYLYETEEEGKEQLELKRSEKQSRYKKYSARYAPVRSVAREDSLLLDTCTAIARLCRYVELFMGANLFSGGRLN